ncbi:hypothetical protein [Elizabethkingia anophelis]|uniref:hypothetical protein n=1 Tax=Elizabethkingia anophelis TaxID=1117645 RepID=UPI0038919FC5
MKKKAIILSTAVILTFTVGITLLEAKFFGSETVLGKCMWMGGDRYEAPVLKKSYVFWIPTGVKATGDWALCIPE